MAKRLCPIHGLWNKEKKSDRCPECKKIGAKAYSKTKQDKGRHRFYNSSAWKKVRELVKIRDAGLCQECKRIGIMHKSDVVDHIVEIEDNGCRLCMDNLECLCALHHHQKTAREKRRRDEPDK